TLGGTNSYANSINAGGQVVGSANTTGNTAQHAVLWDKRGAATDLGTIGGTNSFANFINGRRQIVGYADTVGDVDQPAVLCNTPSTPIDLNTQIPAGSGWVLMNALGINDKGKIVGIGTIGGEMHAFLLTPQAPRGVAAGEDDGILAGAMLATL